MRITSISNPHLVNCNYRSYQPLLALGQRGHTIRVNGKDEPRFRVPLLRRSDVVHIHRYTDAEVRQLARTLRQRNLALVWDNDDDLGAVPRDSTLYRSMGGFKGMRAVGEIKEMLGIVHAVTTPSEELAARYREMGAAAVHVLENYVADHYLLEKPRPHRGVVIGWLAGREHQVDYQQLRLQETFERLLAAHPDVEFVSIGLGLGLRTERYQHVPLLRWITELAPALAGFDIGIAPLADIPFNRARSNIKLKEYASVGVPWLASPVGPYLGMGEKQGGRLVSDDRWHEELDRLITNARERRKLAKRALKWAKGETISKHVYRWQNVFDEAVERARHEPSYT